MKSKQKCEPKLLKEKNNVEYERPVLKEFSGNKDLFELWGES